MVCEWMSGTVTQSGRFLFTSLQNKVCDRNKCLLHSMITNGILGDTADFYLISS